MTVADIQIAILNGTFTERELRDINGTIVNALKADRKAKINEAKCKFRVGDNVTFKQTRGITTLHHVGVIIKVNRTKCKVDTGGIRGTWNVPMTMLRAA